MTAVLGLFLGVLLGMLVFTVMPQKSAWATAFSSFKSRLFRSSIYDQSPAGRDALYRVILAASRQYQVEPELVWAVVAVESGFDSKARSRRGAYGFMQLMPATARAVGVTDVRDPVQNVYGGVRYLRKMLDRFGGDRRLALAAYNAGPNAVRRYRGVPPYRETRNYVTRVLNRYHAERRRRLGAG